MHISESFENQRINQAVKPADISTFADCLPALYWNVAEDGTLRATNSLFDEFVRPQSGEWSTPLPDDRVHSEDLARLRAWWESLKKESRKAEIELRLLPADGTPRWFLVLAAPAFAADGSASSWHCMAVDIDAQRQREVLLRNSEEEFHTIVDAIAQYVVVLDAEGAVIYVNRVVTEQTGMSLSTVSGDPDAFAHPFHPDDLESVRQARREGLEKGTAFELEVRVRVRDGQYRWYLMQYKPAKDEHDRVLRWYVTGTDIHEQKQQRETLQKENYALREELGRSADADEIIGTSAPILRLRKQLSRVAQSDSTVLLLGETGTGKELAARALHRQSKRNRQPFIRVNCAAIPQSLISSELFGHEKGAFTGATQRRQGKFEAADGGTLFLDEVGDLPMETQVALLRVLQEREIERIGSNSPVPVDIRLIAATHRNLLECVEEGTFREDLFYRLNVLPMTMPPLRERIEDIPILVERFVARFGEKSGKRIRHIEKGTLSRLQSYEWPGNVRELQNVIERAVILSDDDTLFFDESWLNRGERAGAIETNRRLTDLARQEKAMIESALAESRGRIAGPNGAAARLGIPRQTLESKMKKFGIAKP